MADRPIRVIANDDVREALAELDEADLLGDAIEMLSGVAHDLDVAPSECTAEWLALQHAIVEGCVTILAEIAERRGYGVRVGNDP